MLRSFVGSFSRQVSPLAAAARSLNVHEHFAHELLRKFDVGCPAGGVALSGEEAMAVAQGLPGKKYVVKAQILAGGRGLGKFKNGFKGGVHLTEDIEKVGELASKMIGQTLVTKQTGEEGRPVAKVLVSEALFPRREVYFAILLDRESQVSRSIVSL